MLTRFTTGHHHVTCAKVASLLQMVLIGFSSVIGVIMPSIMSTQIPRFLPTPTNVTYRRGQLATLACSVEKLGTKFDGQSCLRCVRLIKLAAQLDNIHFRNHCFQPYELIVVWRKASDPNPLTVGKEKFADDPNIGVSHDSTNWNLVIRNVQPRHAGVYECQVSSVHQLIRHILLRVVDDTIKKNGFLTISGSRYVVRGSAISLMCNSSGGDSRSRDINWYKEGIKILSNRDSRILTAKYTSADKVTISSLRIDNSRLEDGGTYVCRTPNKASIAIAVSVQNNSGINANGTNVKREEHKAGSEQAYWGEMSNRIEPTQTTNGQISNSQFTPQLPCFFLPFYLLLYSFQHL